MKRLLKPLLLFTILCSITNNIHSQVAINTTSADPDKSAMLDIESKDKGILIPRLSTETIIGIPKPAEGLLVYNSTTHSFFFFNGIRWKDLSKNIPLRESLDAQDLLNIKPQNEPNEATEGDIYMDSKTHKLRCWNGIEWKDFW